MAFGKGFRVDEPKIEESEKEEPVKEPVVERPREPSGEVKQEEKSAIEKPVVDLTEDKAKEKEIEKSSFYGSPEELKDLVVEELGGEKGEKQEEIVGVVLKTVERLQEAREWDRLLFDEALREGEVEEAEKDLGEARQDLIKAYKKEKRTLGTAIMAKKEGGDLTALLEEYEEAKIICDSTRSAYAMTETLLLAAMKEKRGLKRKKMIEEGEKKDRFERFTRWFRKNRDIEVIEKEEKGWIKETMKAHNKKESKLFKKAGIRFIER